MIARISFLAVATAGLINPACRAADKPGGFQLSPKFYLAPDRFLLLSRRYVTEELQFTAEEKLRIARARREVQRLRSTEVFALRRIKDEKLIRAYHAMLTKVAHESDRQLKSALPPEKYQRFSELHMQARGMRAFFDPDVQKALQISKAQKTAFGEIQDQAIVADRKLRRDAGKGKREYVRTKQGEIDDRARKKLLRQLTADQRKKYKKMLGKPLHPQSPALSILLPTSEYIDIPSDLYRRLKNARRRSK